MNNIKQTLHTPMFDGVFIKHNDTSIYRIVLITAENREKLKKLIPKECHSVIHKAFNGQYLLENPNNFLKYEIINFNEFITFDKLNKEDASKILSGINC